MSAARIRELNDAFRLDPQRWGRLMITCGVQEMGAAFVEKAIIAARTFDRFTPDNDPHGEHDFASMIIDGTTVFWKIDYFDKRMEYGSEDPADSRKTTRVLTVMLAEEY